MVRVYSHAHSSATLVPHFLWSLCAFFFTFSVPTVTAEVNKQLFTNHVKKAVLQILCLLRKKSSEICQKTKDCFTVIQKCINVDIAVHCRTGSVIHPLANNNNKSHYVQVLDPDCKSKYRQLLLLGSSQTGLAREFQISQFSKENAKKASAGNFARCTKRIFYTDMNAMLSFLFFK